MKRYVLHMLVALNCLLLAGLLWMWVGQDGKLRNVHWQAPVPQTTDYAAMIPALPGISPADTSQFIAMLDRPLFSLTRRPPPPPPPPDAKEQPPEDNLSTARLTGIFRGIGDGGIIIQLAGKHRRVRLNESVEGWSLTAIEDRSVTFAKGGQTRVLQLPRALLATYSGVSLPPAASANAERRTPRIPATAEASADNSNDSAASAAPPNPGPVSRPAPRPSFGGGGR